MRGCVPPKPQGFGLGFRAWDKTTPPHSAIRFRFTSRPKQLSNRTRLSTREYDNVQMLVQTQAYSYGALANSTWPLLTGEKAKKQGFKTLDEPDSTSFYSRRWSAVRFHQDHSCDMCSELAKAYRRQIERRTAIRLFTHVFGDYYYGGVGHSLIVRAGQ